MTTPGPLPLAEGEVLLLDGGASTALQARGHDLDGPLWSARLLLEDPEAVRAMHCDFLEAGAEVVLTLTYQLSGGGLVRAGASAAVLGEMTRRAVALAREAVQGARHGRGHGRPRWVAASLGPYGALLADGSEYRGRYGLGRGRLRDVHAPRLGAVLDAGPDLLALETVPSGVEVAAWAELLDGAPLPAWVTVTAAGDGTRTPEGEPVDEALGPAIEAPRVAAVGVNCTAPELVPAALDRLGGVGLPLVAKPNAGRRWDEGAGGWRRGCLADPAPWLAAGARLVGGCCGTDPSDLREVADRVREAVGDVSGDGR
jgi:homocysteine S-methyltransferase